MIKASLSFLLACIGIKQLSQAWNTFQYSKTHDLPEEKERAGGCGFEIVGEEE